MTASLSITKQRQLYQKRGEKLMKKISKILALVLSAALLSTCLIGCGASGTAQTSNEEAVSVETSKAEASSESREIRLAIQPSCAFIPFIIARQTGWIDEAMKEIGVNVVWTDFESGPPMNESFAAGQQDIGVIGDVPAVSAVAAGQQNVYIAAEEGGSFIAVLVRDDSGIETVEDLKGKKLGITIGSTSQNFVQKLLTKAGLDPASDVEMINISAGDAQIVLTNGDVDAVAIWEPTVSRMDALDNVHILANGEEAGFLGMNIVFARKEFVDQNPDLVKVFLEQYWKATKAYEENPEEYVDMLAEYFNLDKDLVLQASSKCKYVLAFNEEEAAAMQDTVSFLMGIGTISNEINVNDYIADDIAKEVIAESK